MKNRLTYIVQVLISHTRNPVLIWNGLFILSSFSWHVPWMHERVEKQSQSDGRVGGRRSDQLCHWWNMHSQQRRPMRIRFHGSAFVFLSFLLLLLLLSFFKAFYSICIHFGCARSGKMDTINSVAFQSIWLSPSPHSTCQKSRAPLLNCPSLSDDKVLRFLAAARFVRGFCWACPIFGVGCSSPKFIVRRHILQCES